MKTSSILFLLTFLTFNCTFAQDKWVKTLKNGGNFFEIKKTFEEEWKDKEYVKGNGWKQFKRFEYYWQSRINPDGSFPDVNKVYAGQQELQKIKSISNKTTASNWHPVGPQMVSYGNGRVNVIEVDPNNPNTIYLGSPSGGCWKTTNAGQNWIPLTDNMPTLTCSGIAVDPNNSNNVFITTGDFDHWQGYGTGVYRSQNGGLTWTATSMVWNRADGIRGGKIKFAPNNSNILYFINHSGLYKTTNSGTTWTQTQFEDIEDFEFQPNDPNIIYSVSSDKFFKSTDGGNTFNQISIGLPQSSSRMQVAVTPSNPDVVYVFAAESDSSMIFKSDDNGNSFIQVHDVTTGHIFSNQYWYDMAACISPVDEDLLITGGVYTNRCNDGGLNFESINTNMHVDIHFLEYIGNYLYCGNDGGIYRSNNNGSTWENLIGDLQITQYYKFSNARTDSTRISAGAQDNGTFFRNNGVWDRIGGGDGMDNEIDYTNPDIIYLSWQNGNFTKSINAGLNDFGIFTNITENGSWVTPIQIDPNNPNTVYVGFENVWKSTDGGLTSSKISNFNGGSMNLVKVAEHNSNYIIATKGSEIQITKNGGTTWTDISISSTYISSIEFHPSDENKIWATLSSYDAGEKVYFSSNAGLTWTNISSNLPNIPAHSIIFHKGTPNEDMYLGMDGAIFYKNNLSSNWTLYMSGMPNVDVTELEIPYGYNVLRASTFGRGVWESPVMTQTIAQPIALFKISTQKTCLNKPIQYTNQSVHFTNVVRWDFPGGTPSTSTLANPIVTYSNPGTYNAQLIVTNGTSNDTILKTAIIQVGIDSVNLNFNEPFNQGVISNKWTLVNDDAGQTWKGVDTLGGFGINTGCAILGNYSYNANGSSDFLQSPTVDLNLYNVQTLTFDVAFCQYGNTYSDTMAVYYSQDCGDTKIKLWEKGGADLGTKPTSSTQFFPLANEWRTETIDLTTISFVQIPTSFYFENRGYYGNNLFVDNINIIGALILKNDSEINSKYQIYPNPTNNFITIQSEISSKTNLKIFDLQGKLLIEENTSSFPYILKMNNLPTGMYVLEIESEKGKVFEKIIKE